MLEHLNPHWTQPTTVICLLVSPRTLFSKEKCLSINVHLDVALLNTVIEYIYQCAQAQEQEVSGMKSFVHGDAGSKLVEEAHETVTHPRCHDADVQRLCADMSKVQRHTYTTNPALVQNPR